MNELEHIERAAFRSLWQLAPAELAHAEGIATAEVGGATCVAFRAVPTTMLNRVLGVGVERPVTEPDLDQITAFFPNRFAVALAPNAQPSTLPALLEGRGFASAYAWMKFRRDTSPSPPTTTKLAVVEIGAERGHDFGRVVAEGFGLPPRSPEWWSRIAGAPHWHCFVAYAGADPAAAGAVYVEGTTGWLGIAATRPEFRGRGGQGAILAARIDAARNAGATLLVTETGERVADRPSASYRNILRAGFEEAYLRPNFERNVET